MARPNPRDFIENWRRSDRPFPVKLAQALRNNALKAVRRSDCCGNYGEPGC